MQYCVLQKNLSVYYTELTQDRFIIHTSKDKNFIAYICTELEK